MTTMSWSAGRDSWAIGWKRRLFRKVQQVSVSQSPLQRRKNLAALHVHLATGSITLAYVESATAKRLRDYILFRAAASRLAWH